MRRTLPYVRDEMERMLRLTSSTASGLIGYSKLLGDRYHTRNIYHLIRNWIVQDLKDGVMPNFAYDLQNVAGLTGSTREQYVYHLVDLNRGTDPYDKQIQADAELLVGTLRSLRNKSRAHSTTWNCCNAVIDQLIWVYGVQSDLVEHIRRGEEDE